LTREAAPLADPVVPESSREDALTDYLIWVVVATDLRHI
jgi:hypothetical protein